MSTKNAIVSDKKRETKKGGPSPHRAGGETHHGAAHPPEADIRQLSLFQEEQSLNQRQELKRRSKIL